MSKFSMIIPVKPGGEVAALSSLRQLDARGQSFEIIVVEGCAPSQQRNKAAREAEGEILYFLDDDSQITPECLLLAEQVLNDPAVAVIGGPSLTPAEDTPLQKVFGLALGSLLGAGGMRNRYRATGGVRETNDRELILCNLLIRREAFLQAGGFDVRLYPNEENELLDRLSREGLKLVHVPALHVTRSQRRTMKQFIRQMFSYGRGRAQQTLIAGPGSPASYIPLVFVLYVALLPLLPLGALWQLPLLLYILLTAIFSVHEVILTRRSFNLLLLFIYPIMHISNGVGLLAGFIGGTPAPPSCAQSTIVTKRIKNFDQVEW